MNRLIHILRKSHCHRAHHRLAIDALTEIQTAAGLRLARLVARNYPHYLRGSIAPDVEFRDFKNHVILVSQQNWGGATHLADFWYRKACEKLQQKRWTEAVHALGVLSHYFTDPMLPLQTTIGDDHSIYHLPLNWAVYRNYQQAYDRFRSGAFRITFQLARHSEFLKDAQESAASLCAEHSEPLMRGLDLNQCVLQPTKALSADSIDRLAMILGLAVQGWARVLERLAEESAIEIPRVQLASTTFLTAIDVPLQLSIKRWKDRLEQSAVRSLVTEYRETGKVVEHVPEAVRSVQSEWLSDRVDSSNSTRATDPQATSMEFLEPGIDAGPVILSIEEARLQKENSSKRWLPIGTGDASPFKTEHLTSTDGFSSTPIDLATHWIVDLDASVIERFQTLGIHTLADFLDWNAAVLSIRLKDRDIPPSKVQGWKDQLASQSSIAFDRPLARRGVA